VFDGWRRPTGRSQHRHGDLGCSRSNFGIGRRPSGRAMDRNLACVAAAKTISATSSSLRGNPERGDSARSGLKGSWQAHSARLSSCHVVQTLRGRFRRGAAATCRFAADLIGSTANKLKTEDGSRARLGTSGLPAASTILPPTRQSDDARNGSGRACFGGGKPYPRPTDRAILSFRPAQAGLRF